MKVYKIDREVMVAVCDEKYLGKEFSEGNAQLKVSDKFYGRTQATCEEVTAALQDATIANLVGEESVACAIDAGVIESDHIIYIAEVPHAQMISM
ncbi:MAG TPA: DUF424 family protein [Methanocella sp.]|jgi:hypothetical protein